MRVVVASPVTGVPAGEVDQRGEERACAGGVDLPLEDADLVEGRAAARCPPPRRSTVADRIVDARHLALGRGRASSARPTSAMSSPISSSDSRIERRAR